MILSITELINEYYNVWRVIRIVLPILLIFVVYYNIMLTKRNRIKNAISTIDVMLKKRNDLIPNLVNSVKGIMEHERMVLERLVELRNSLGTVSKKEEENINNSIDKYLSQIILLSENYPNLMSNRNFLDLQKSLRDIEETISAARRTYNMRVTNYNTFISIIPNILFAKLFRFKKYELFEIKEDEKEGKINFHEN